MATLRRARGAWFLLPCLLVTASACGSSSPDSSSGGGASDDATGSGEGGAAASTSSSSSSGSSTSSDSSTSSGCVGEPPACHDDDRADDTCDAGQDDCYAVTGCGTVECRRTVACSLVEGDSGIDGEVVSVDDGQACAVEGEVCDGIRDGVAHCSASAECQDGYWVQIGSCDPDEEK